MILPARDSRRLTVQALRQYFDFYATVFSALRFGLIAVKRLVFTVSFKIDGYRSRDQFLQLQLDGLRSFLRQAVVVLGASGIIGMTVKCNLR